MSIVLPMSPSGFQNAMNKYLDLHRSYLFRVMIFDGTAIGSIAGAVVTELIANTVTPVSTTTQISLGWQGSKSKVAGKTDFQNWNVTIRDDAVNAVHTYFSTWRDRVYSATTGQTQALTDNGGYKKSAIIMMLTNSSLVSLESLAGVRGYVLHGIWPTEVGQITLDYSSETVATFPVTLSMDYFESLSATQSLLNVAQRLF
jgi:hypothetical protein